jgi:hypothetical protein
MKKKGLCSTCTNDKDCDFPRKFPVYQCEEFNGYEATPKGKRINNKKKQKTITEKKAMASI